MLMSMASDQAFAGPRVERGSARRLLLDAAVQLIRQRGLSATTVDDVCAAAGVTKGAFFHHFPTKEALAIAAAEHWSASTGSLFATAEYHGRPSAAERVLGYLDLRVSLAQGDVTDLSCLAGTMAQEAYLTQPAVRQACGATILGHATTLETDLEQALREAGHGTDIEAAGLARHVQAVIQGSIVLAKAANDPSLAGESLAHLRRYLTCLLGRADPGSPPSRATDAAAGQHH